MEETIKIIKGSKGYIRVLREEYAGERYLLSWKGEIKTKINKDLINTTFPFDKAISVSPYIEGCSGIAWINSLSDPDEYSDKQEHDITVNFIGAGMLKEDMSITERKENIEIKQPTSEQCTNKQIVFENDNRIGYACWYPQMGGYSGHAIAVFDKEWILYDHGSTEGGCIDVFVWHDGDFPFGEEGDEQPRRIHHCSPEQFIGFGQFLEKINNSRCVEKVMVEP